MPPLSFSVSLKLLCLDLFKPSQELFAEAARTGVTGDAGGGRAAQAERIAHGDHPIRAMPISGQAVYLKRLS